MKTHAEIKAFILAARERGEKYIGRYARATTEALCGGSDAANPEVAETYRQVCAVMRELDEGKSLFDCIK